MSVLASCLFLVGAALAAADRPPGPDGPYDPGPEHPFGRPNPEAPEELAQFAFMIGEFDCLDRIRQADGSWLEFPASWHGSYFLNGFGILDRYWSGRIATSNARVFDPDAGNWKVTFFKMPGYGSGVWEGGVEGETIVMRRELPGPDGSTVESRLTFSDVTDRSYEWRSETVRGDRATVGWTSSCRRRAAD